MPGVGLARPGKAVGPRAAGRDFSPERARGPLVQVVRHAPAAPAGPGRLPLGIAGQLGARLRVVPPVAWRQQIRVARQEAAAPPAVSQRRAVVFLGRGPSALRGLPGHPPPLPAPARRLRHPSAAGGGAPEAMSLIGARRHHRPLRAPRSRLARPVRQGDPRPRLGPSAHAGREPTRRAGRACPSGHAPAQRAPPPPGSARRRAGKLFGNWRPAGAALAPLLPPPAPGAKSRHGRQGAATTVRPHRGRRAARPRQAGARRARAWACRR